MFQAIKRLLSGQCAAPPGAEDRMPRKKFRVFCACGWMHVNEAGQIRPVHADDLYLAIIKGRALHKGLLASVINIDAALNPSTPLHYLDAEEIG